MKTTKPLLKFSFLLASGLVLGFAVWNAGTLRSLLDPHSNLPVVAEIQSFMPVAKTRDAKEFFWRTAFSHQLLHEGDGIYTPKGSKAVLILKHGAILDLDEETVILFPSRGAHNQEVPQLERGNFLLTLQGQLPLKLAGENVELEGQDSLVQIYFDPAGQLRLHLLAGDATLKTAHAKFALQKEKLASLSVPDIQTPPDPILSQAAKVHPQQPLNEYSYVLHFNDLYQASGEQNVEQKISEPDQVEMPLDLTWKTEGLPKLVYGEISRLRDFKTRVPFQAQGDSYQINKVYLGDNFWRISTDGRQWESAYFKVSAEWAKASPPRVHISGHRLGLVHGIAKVAWPLESHEPFKAFVVEVSHQPVFVPGQTDLVWVSDGIFKATFVKPESVFLRVRGVTQNFELSEFSPAEKIRVVKGKSVGPRTPATSKSNRVHP